jgi:hypothetical protein
MQAPKRRGGGVWRTGQRERLPGGPRQAAGAHRFKKGQSGNRGGRGTKTLPALPAAAQNETVVVTIDGRRRTITKREAIVTRSTNRRVPICARPRC